jgi:hypothetical protein
MDLNIGTAFWFASRGKGYLCSYDTIDEAALYSIMSDNGRPLVRIGEEGALASKGHHKKTPEELKEEEEIIYDSQGNIPCRYPGCQRSAKQGCRKYYCKRCCDISYKQEAIAAIEDKTTIQSMEFDNPCPVHKRKKKHQINKNEDAENEEVGTNNNGKEIEPEEVADVSIPSSLLENQERIPYKSHCKVLLVGLGADEQLAGYGRHRTVFLSGGNEALCNEINKDLTRLWQRNLGRFVYEKSNFYLNSF